MPATRLLSRAGRSARRRLQLPAAVHLFDRKHATRILAAFGAAYGRLDGNAAPRQRPAAVFGTGGGRVGRSGLDRAGSIVHLRRNDQVEALVDRHVTRRRAVRRGWGVAFLEEVFDGRSASPMYRLHRKAARLVLERLLPPPAPTFVVTWPQSPNYRLSRAMSERPADFAGLLRCLNHELRLITPSDIEEGPAQPAATEGEVEASPRLYQLTHDFLVTAIRGWLNQSRRRTARGRRAEARRIRRRLFRAFGNQAAPLLVGVAPFADPDATLALASRRAEDDAIGYQASRHTGRAGHQRRPAGGIFWL